MAANTTESLTAGHPVPPPHRSSCSKGLAVNSFLVVIGEEPQISTTAGPTFSFNHASLAVCEPNDRFITVETTEEGFELFVGEHGGDLTAPEFTPAGTRLTYSEPSRALTIECDRLGTSILYWKRSGNKVMVSNRLENLVTTRSEPDWCSIQQYLHTGFTIKDTTFFKAIYQTEANTRMCTRLTGSTTEISITQRDTTPIDPEIGQDELIDRISEQLSQALKTSFPSVLMMSAGWDSRTLLLESQIGITGAYTHGDLSSREVTLARKLSGGRRLDHLFSDVQSCPINTDLLDHMLDELGFGLFPIWFSAAKNISTWKDAPIMSGVLGELLGGHYGLMSWGSRRQKLLASTSLINDSFIREDQIRTTVEDYATPPGTHWFVSGIGQEMLDSHRTHTRLRSMTAIEDSYRKNGNWQGAIEQFNMDHRARQYILKQAQAASSTIGYTIPFANERLTDLVRALDFSHRVHNKANRRILKSRSPELLNTPMAATLIDAKYPVLLQELSRAVRILFETTARLAGKARPRLGWFNYEHLYQCGMLHEIADSLHNDIWSQDRLHETLDTNIENGIDAGSTLDMLTKLKTVDYYLSRST